MTRGRRGTTRGAHPKLAGRASRRVPGVRTDVASAFPKCLYFSVRVAGGLSPAAFPVSSACRARRCGFRAWAMS